jgi:predicted transcriptional regulator
MLDLERLGVNRNVARVITFLKDQNERTFMDIEIATDLKQQKVSNAMQPLRERGWLNEHYIKSNGNGKGRPLKIYSLLSSIYEILNYY